MNRDIVEGGWKQLKGTLQVRWSLIIGDPLGVVSGRQTQYAGERLSAYGVIRSKSPGAAHNRAPRLVSLKPMTATDSPRSVPVFAMRPHKPQQNHADPPNIKLDR